VEVVEVVEGGGEDMDRGSKSRTLVPRALG
jgi:hypothetical protein